MNGETRESPCSSQSPCFLTVSEVARLLRVSRMTVYRLIHSHTLPAISIRGTYRVRVAALDDFLVSDTTHPDHAAVRHAG
ncbi:MAG: helix-turn-helix domain-containing protein [Pseudonocardia sp.]